MAFVYIDDIINGDVGDELKDRKRIINEWKPDREVFNLRYGSLAISVLGGYTGFLCNRMFRKCLNLMRHGFYSTTLFVTLAPAFVTYLSHEYFVVNNMLMYKDHCLLCSELKAIASTTINGFIYPLIIAPTIGLPLAGNLGLRVPYIYEVNEIGRFCKVVVTLHRSVLLKCLIANSIMAGFVTYKQLKEVKLLEEVLMKVQKYIDDYKLEDTETRAVRNDKELNFPS
ncbi:transmembrane protein 126 [Xylocopa sonorina]|uniref:transmembrane protein 126 n=1 Tax=Xylocopa sonorina TaxID=1818115 RepID=UPI00403AE7C5